MREINIIQRTALRLLGLRSLESNLANPSKWLLDMYGNTTASGISVSEQSAMQCAAVFSCVKVLSETIASLPLVLFKKTGKNKSRATEHYLYGLMHDRPNPMMSSFTWRETIVPQLLLWGNIYQEIIDDGAGRIKEIWPLNPTTVRVRQSGRKLFYWVSDPTYRPLINPFHIPGLGFDGLVGKSVIGMMRESVGLALTAEQYGAAYFGNGARPGGVLETDAKMDQTVIDRLKASWNEIHQGSSNSHKVAVLEQGLKYHQIGLPPEDSQFLETRKFQRSEIASIFRVPPHMIGDLERATFSNIEQQSIEFATNTIRPWCVRLEQALNWALLSEAERAQGYYFEFVLDGLLRGDVQSRYTAYATGKQNGFLSTNDIRTLENLDEVDGGDMLWVPVNVMPADLAEDFWKSKIVKEVPSEKGNSDDGGTAGDQSGNGNGTDND